jgi:hypothetical protein
MKILSAAVSDLISKKGIEPVNILEIQWVEGGNYLKYGDKEILNYEFPVEGVILNLSNLESTIKLDSQGQSQSINVTLDDTNGKIKDIINFNDIHGRIVKLYQWFETLPLSERFQLYEGEISSPIVWNEGDRTVSFSVITKLAEKEVGFSPEEAQFDFIPNDLVGKPWPMAFGTVQNVPATRLQDVPITQTAEDLNIADPSIGAHGSILGGQIAQLEFWVELLKAYLVQATHNADPRLLTSTPEQVAFWEGIVEQLTQQLAQAVSQLIAARKERSDNNLVKDKQEELQKDTLELIDASAFPEGPITLAIDGVTLNGIVSANVFTITSRILNNYNWQEGDEPFGLTFVQAGSTITLQTETEIIYVVNITSSIVHSVQAFRQIENGQILVTIPSNFYTVREVTSGPYTFTLIEMSLPLSSRDKTLGNDIYVTQTGSIGPNTVDILIWLIDTYTDLAYDTISFNSVKAKIENYPSHFALLERKNILTVLEEIAMQARCAIWLTNGIFYIKYLSEELTEDITITESDIDAGSMVLEATETEELVTKLVATWTDNYVLEESHKIILRHNVKKYGTREREINFYIYNINELVLKSATFWLIRLANIWKVLNFSTYVSNLSMETFDTVLLNFNQNYIASTPIKSLVTDLVYDTNNGLLNTICWLPVKFGEMTQYDFSWPSQVSVDLIFPTATEVIKKYDGSDGPGKDVKINEIVATSIVNVNYSVFDDRGDKRPSDIDDVKPIPRFPGTSFEAGEETPFDYGYNSFIFDPTTPPPPPDDEFVGAVFPGVIVSKHSIVNQISLYNVNIYIDGLLAPSTLKIVHQLQLDEDEVIPPDTWCLVAKNQTEIINEETGERAPGINNDGFEWTMQIPIWL